MRPKSPHRRRARRDATEQEVHIAGAGPAGSAAGIAASVAGARVRLYERSRLPRHKVCGEFIPAEACRVLETLGAWGAFLDAEPPIIRRCELRFGARSKRWLLPDPAYSLSRFALDRLLEGRAESAGCRIVRGAVLPAIASGGAVVLANGRRRDASARPRLFGFKAHFSGPQDDAVELHFTRFGYVGISSIEGGRTNVCGIAPEDVLRAHGFAVDELLGSDRGLGGRLGPLRREMEWLTTGPLVFSPAGSSGESPSVYRAGDAFGFIDPFTGSGILNALLTGSLAGRAAAQRRSAESYARECRMRLARPFAVSSLFRLLARSGLSRAAFLIPGEWLYRLTRVWPG